MAEPKTRPTKQRVSDFIASVENPDRRREAKVVMKIMREESGKRATMWGASIVGFDTYTPADGKSAQWMLTGFSPRKGDLSIYIMNGFATYGALLKKLGKHRTGKSCLYVKSLDDIDEEILREIIRRSLRDMRKMYPDV